MGYILFAIAAALYLYQLNSSRRQATRLKHFSESVRQRTAYLEEEERKSRDSTMHALQQSYNSLIEDYRVMEVIAESETGRIEMMLRQLQEAVLLLDHAGNIISCNPAAETLFYIPPHRLQGNHSIYPYIKSTDFLDYMTHIQQGGPQTQREIAFEREGRTVWFEVAGAPLPQQVVRFNQAPGKGTRVYLFVMHDITRLKDLEDIRREFVANVSHELRTPITVIKGFTDTLLNDHNRISSEDREKFLLKIHRNVERFHMLLEDLLQLSRLESDRLTLNRREIPVRTLFDDACEHVRHRLKDNQQIAIDISPEVASIWVDELKFMQILNNLIDNAIRYAKGFTKITLSTRKEGRMLWFTVEDDGQGVPEKDLPHLFERFYRVDKGRSRESGGTGLGLSIVKHIVLMHGGEVKAESRLGEGTRIRFSIPIRSV